MPSIATIYPTNAREVALFIAALSPLVVWSLGALVRAWSYRREQQDARWRRLHELTLILYNNQHASGLWGQILAVREMRCLKGRISDAKDIAALTSIHFKTLAQNDGIRVLISELDDFAQPGRDKEPKWLGDLRTKAAAGIAAPTSIN